MQIRLGDTRWHKIPIWKAKGFTCYLLSEHQFSCPSTCSYSLLRSALRLFTAWRPISKIKPSWSLCYRNTITCSIDQPKTNQQLVTKSIHSFAILLLSIALLFSCWPTAHQCQSKITAVLWEGQIFSFPSLTQIVRNNLF